MLSVLDEVNYKLTQQSEVDCQILCLKMLSKILNYRSDALECYYNYLKQISQKVAHLSDQDKEVFYTEVKRLIKIIKTKVDTKQDVEMTVDSGSEEQDTYMR